MSDSCLTGVPKPAASLCHRQEVSGDINSQSCTGDVCHSGNPTERPDTPGEYQLCLPILSESLGQSRSKNWRTGVFGTVQVPNYMYDHSHANHWPEFSISYSLCMFHFTKWIKQETASIFSMHQLLEIKFVYFPKSCLWKDP